MKEDVLFVLLGMLMAGVFGIAYFAKGNGYLMFAAILFATVSIIYAFLGA
ncbi:hypothetical protein [Falsiphaeobacter marinintestinus]|nr:hypothetical protein [Phaeobacter marinintestinus]